MDLPLARHRLEQERERLSGLLDSPATADLQTSQQESAGDLSSVDQHPGDAATDTLEREQAESIAEHAKTGLERIEEALARVDAGTYGTCAACGEEIPDERLEAVPATLYCAEHQREAEQRV